MVDMRATDVLVTFLGRVPKDEGGRYRKTQYDFGDGSPVEPVAFFGWTLQKFLRPKRLLILGTSGSMWDHLFEGDLDLGEHGETNRLMLIASVSDMNVTQAQLDALAPLLARHLGCEVDLVIIPYCRIEAEQADLLRIMAERVKTGEHVHLDVTHGFRHLPMLSLLSALHLRLRHQAHIEGIWYGSYDPDTGKAPVYQIDGLLRIADWLQALSSFDKDGDYSVFAPLLIADGLPDDKAQALKRASFAENTLNFGQARERLHTVLKPIHELGGVSALYAPLLYERIGWIREQNDATRLARLTRTALDKGDLMRAAILLPRAFLERMKQPGESTVKYDILDSIEKEFREGKRGLEHLQGDYEQAKRIRNALAHGARPKHSDIRRALANPEALQSMLDRLIRKLIT